MFDIAPTELMLVAVIALVVIGPKDLPRAMRFVGSWLGRARGVARQFRSGFDEMVRQAELDEMEAKWKAENARIMREHPAADPTGHDDTRHDDLQHDDVASEIMMDRDAGMLPLPPGAPPKPAADHPVPDRHE